MRDVFQHVCEFKSDGYMAFVIATLNKKKFSDIHGTIFENDELETLLSVLYRYSTEYLNQTRMIRRILLIRILLMLIFSHVIDKLLWRDKGVWKLNSNDGDNGDW